MESTDKIMDEVIEPEDRLFGADFFSLQPGLFSPPGFGPVPPDYFVGPGDQLYIDVFGEVEFRLERVVDRDGSIILPRGGKVLCAGRTLQQVTQAVRGKLSGSYSGIESSGDGGTTFVDVSLGALRVIRVFVVGEARQPGAVELSSVSTAFTALYAAGGPNNAGSLRDVRVMRGSELIATVDLYGYLLEGRRGTDPILRDGDTVFIPPRGTTVSVVGEVRRPMRYEMLPDEGVRDLVRFAGGFTATAVPDMLHVERIVAPQQRSAEMPDRRHIDLDLREKKIHTLHDGDAVTVYRVADRLENWVEVQGNVKQSGRYQYREGMTAASLVARAGGLWADTLEERAIIERTDPDRKHITLSFNLGAAMSGQEKVVLQAGDKLRVLSIWDIRSRTEVRISGAVREPGTFEWREGITLRDLVLLAGGLEDSADLLRAEVSRVDWDAVESRGNGAAPERSVVVTRVELGADWLSSDRLHELQPYDHVAIRKLPWWETQRVVHLRGEVYYPGDYVLDSSDERLSSVIERAGGLKPNAYVPGACIVRGKDGVGKVALDLKEALKHMGGEQDAVLVAGDEIRIPEQPFTVKVDGAVGFPTSFVYSDGSSIGDYVSRAGGYAENADRGKTHVVYSNGASGQVRRFWRDPGVAPGATIIVPQKVPDHGDGKLETLKEIASIFASVATVWLVIDRTQ